MEHDTAEVRLHIGIKVSREDRDKLQAAAKKEDRALANWARKTLLAVVDARDSECDEETYKARTA